MSTTWEEADERLIALAESVIRRWHLHLLDARVGFLYRSESGVSQGKEVIGKAKKVSEELRVLLDLDFLVWISKPAWLALSPEGREALLDHELSHLAGDEVDGWSIRAHDVEEFVAVIERHGLWHPVLARLAEPPVQLRFSEFRASEFAAGGAVVAVEPGGVLVGAALEADD